MPALSPAPSGIELSEVEAAVGPTSFQRGRTYARHKVLSIAWDAGGQTLTGRVVGRNALYDTAAFFVAGRGGGLVFEDGECTCPVGYNCKHVAAIAIVASGGGRAGTRNAPAGRVPVHAPPPPAPLAPSPAPPRHAWEQPLRALIDAPAAQTGRQSLAIELAVHYSLVAGRGVPRLVARLMRPGARGGWINGSLTWSGLDSWQIHNADYRSDHLALVRELYAVHRARDGRPSYQYHYAADKTLDLGSCDSPQLWSVLDDAARLGLMLIHARPGLGTIPRAQRGELVIDVTRGEDGAALARPVLGVDGDALEGFEPLLFLGSSGHGVVYAEPAGAGGADGIEGRRLRLVRLARPAPPALQRMLLEGERLQIPASELDRFADELCPSLRHVATVGSSDGSFTPPEVSAPALVLRASYGAGHLLELGWGWDYAVGATTRRVPLGLDGAAGFRDVEAEHTTLDGVALEGSGLEQIGLLDVAGRPSDAPGVWLGGLDCMRFATEALPRLQAQGGFAVEVSGELPDYRDVGDSLQIGVSTTDVSGERDWFDLGVTIAVDGRELPFSEVFVALAAGESQLLLDDGAHFSLLEPRLQSLRQLIEEARALTDTPSAPLRISRYQGGLWSELAALGVVTEQAQAWQRQADALAKLEALPERELPAALQAQLRPYQRDGFAWLAALWELELGGILADDMGLGKTLQALALICHARERTPDGGPFLVVAPTSVVSNWAAEAARFAPGLRVATITDTLARSGRAIDDVAGAADIVVTTYTLLRLEIDAYHTVAWAGLLLDEAQYVKNHQAKTYRCVRELAAPFKLAITGTPMENSLMELWSLLSITAPGLFPDPKRFAEQYARPIERGGDGERLARLRRRIKPLVMRRTKQLVAADLPAKQEQALVVDLHPRHRKLYDRHLQRERQRILGLIDDFDRNRFTILRSITLLRQLSLHAGLVDDTADGVPCAKLGALVEQLGDVAGGGHRALVFSQFTGFLAKVRERLDAEGIDYCYLDGRTRRRDRVLDQFKNGNDPVFLISLKAGGFGLNLTEADYCFLLDPWWNPATEAQAIDRTHRIGQTRAVMVYRLIARDTIEEKVVALAQRKAALFAGVMDDGDVFASRLTAQDIRGLLG